MDKIIQEGNLQFDFSSSVKVWEYDREIGAKMSHCMKCVDFIVEWEEEIWLIEVKDPEDPKIPKQYKKKQYDNFISKLKHDELFFQELGPKAKDTFLYLYLSGALGKKPLKYLVLLGLDSFSDSQIQPLNTTLKRSICFLGPENKAWTNQYLKEALVFNLKKWNKYFPVCPIKRKGS